ncbi:hypothetical protein [Brevundimonas sp.]|jgi:uncharacterized membrane protein|uniref:hypothetical protein n=1 Tax=Brevundimonas sp. TaxID=1871086 RepID=UPI0035682BD5
MTVLPPEPGRPRFNQTHESAGKPAAMIVWVLYLLALPSANLLAIVGMLVAASARGGATGLARQHLDRQLKLFWTSAVINIVLTGICMVGIVSLAMDPSQAAWLLPLTVVSGLALIGLTLWFTVRSAIAALNLARDRAP